ncbi:hypothetical protein SYK_02560 [Pseudodesulfovibrio nedwellii]|uniref:DUF1351 domain-containing protein n=1 Tax=Pseudodesulfovibrio nedwellii TaxID=2973072 RepID=A0ABN6S1W3_9BACT|nr:DUF1351 domain-containing protein [Pseudodesulfovibrio nedwellii]BDQ35896.1 hypothetical protein SYK_02560 [Pseudodesulfovibrio nedwellii]
MGMELKIISPSEDGYIKSIEFNFDELKTGLGSSLEKYQGLAYTDETIQEAKKDRATLNTLKKALNAKRLEIKKRCLAPYDEFEAKIKELTGLVDQPMLAIDSQVKGYEERKRTEKSDKIKAYWDAQESNVKTLVQLDRIFDKRWLNVTYSMAKVETAITDFFEKVESELALIEELDTEFSDQVVRMYLKEFNVAKAMAENKALIEQKAQREEYTRQQEEAAAKAKAEAEALAQERRQEEAAASQIVEPEPQPEPTQPVEIQQQAQPESNPVHQVDFRVWATTDELRELGRYMKSRGIKYGRVTNEQAA